MKIWDHLMAQTKELVHDQFHFLAIAPWLFAVKLAAGAVKTHNRREYTKLQPAKCKLIILVAHHVTTNVVAPPTIADIGGCCGEVRLEI